MRTKKAMELIERAVLVTTEFRGVFFGYLSPEEKLRVGGSIALKRARNVIYWSSSVKGFLGLASTGPNSECRVGPAADILLLKVTCVATVTEVARVAWESAPWK